MSIHEILPNEILVMVLRLLDYESVKEANAVCRKWRQIIKKIESKYHFVIVLGGATWPKISVDTIFGGLNKPKIPRLPYGQPAVYDCTMTNHFGTILVCGGNPNISKQCYQLKGKTWTKHSNLIKMRLRSSAVTTKDATFIFGGANRKTYEYLPRGSTKWVLGKTEIPGVGFGSGSAIAISDDEIWLIGGVCAEKRILSFDATNHVFTELPITLKVGREFHRCEFIPLTKKIMITGGYETLRDKILNSTEILDVENKRIKLAKSMNFKRSQHGIGILTIEGKNVLAVFGGYSEKSKMEPGFVEIYNAQTQKWEISNIKLKEHYRRFGFLSVKPGFNFVFK